jgi:hypothetical protein
MPPDFSGFFQILIHRICYYGWTINNWYNNHNTVDYQNIYIGDNNE